MTVTLTVTRAAGGPRGPRMLRETSPIATSHNEKCQAQARTFEAASSFCPFAPVQSFLVAKVSIGERRCCGDIDRVVTSPLLAQDRVRTRVSRVSSHDSSIKSLFHGRSAHYDRPTKAIGRLARRSDQPARSAGRQPSRAAASRQSRCQ